jgi:hypothetical protein
MEYTFYKLSIAGKCYVGSTTNFKNRMKKHKCACKKEDCKVYKYIRENGGWNDVKFMIIDKIIYNDKEQAREMETKFMLSFNAELNMCYPKRSIKEWYEVNKESQNEKGRKYYQENRDKLLKRHKEYNEENRDKIIIKKKEYREKNKEVIVERSKKYYDENKDKKKEYYEANKEKKKEYYKKQNEIRKEKVACDICSKMICKGYISKHKELQH